MRMSLKTMSRNYPPKSPKRHSERLGDLIRNLETPGKTGRVALAGMFLALCHVHCEGPRKFKCLVQRENSSLTGIQCTNHEGMAPHCSDKSYACSSSTTSFVPLPPMHLVFLQFSVKILLSVLLWMLSYLSLPFGRCCRVNNPTGDYTCNLKIRPLKIVNFLSVF